MQGKQGDGGNVTVTLTVFKDMSACQATLRTLAKDRLAEERSIHKLSITIMTVQSAQLRCAEM